MTLPNALLASGKSTQDKPTDVGSKRSLDDKCNESDSKRPNRSVTDITVKPPRKGVPKLNAKFWASFPYDLWERIYAKAWNAWASAWNQTLATDEKARMHAISYESKKEMI